jgi:hypothetical protein
MHLMVRSGSSCEQEKPTGVAGVNNAFGPRRDPGGKKPRRRGLAAFSVDPGTAFLTPTDSYPTEKQPRAFNIDPTGRDLNCQRRDELCHRQGDRQLTKLKEDPVGKNPNWGEIVSFSL